MGFCEMKTGGRKGVRAGRRSAKCNIYKMGCKGVHERCWREKKQKKKTWEFTSPLWSRNLHNIKINNVLFFISLWIYIKINTVIRDSRHSNRQGICQLLIKCCADKEGTQPDSSTREWTTGPNPSGSRDHSSLLSTLTSPSTSFLPLFSLLPLASHLVAPLPPPSLCLLSLSSSCPAVTPHFWSNDSQLSTPQRLSRPLSGPDSSTDEIAHRAPLPGPGSVRAILDGIFFLFCFIYSLASFFCLWLCLVVFFVRVYFVFLSVWLSLLCFFLFFLFLLYWWF